jgi:omega-hydroxy-beta-dihydromenaquinone-9 sulfotransferase
VLRELALQRHEHIPLDEIVLDMYPQLMNRLLEEADRLPNHAIVHVRFEDLERNPPGELERVYRQIGLGDYEAARPCIEAYLHSIRHYQKSSHTFSEESIERVTDRWQPFLTRFGYGPPAFERCAA